MTLRAWIVISVVTTMLVGPIAPGSLEAATKKETTDAALLVNQSNRLITLPPGKAVTVWFEFQNVGTSTWTNQDPDPVGLNTDDPLRRKSKFQTKRWRAFWRPTRLLQDKVKPGAVGRFRFAVKAPIKPGIWRESFSLVHGTKTRIAGGQAEFIMIVGQPADLAQVFRAQPKKTSLSFWVKPGDRIYYPLEFRNVGHASWRRDGWGTTNLGRVNPEGSPAIASTSSLSLQTTPTIVKAATRRQYTSAILDIVAPTETGLYRDSFGLVGPNGPISGSAVTVEVNVSQDPQPPFDAEPIVRVGIYAPAKPVVVTANGSYEIRNADTNEYLGTNAADSTATVTYDPTIGRYTLLSNAVATTYPHALRFVPPTDQTIIEIQSFSNKREVTIDGQTATVNDNKFRGAVEVRYAPATSKLWVINELPIEQYLWGLAETTNRAPLEFVKTLVTAARSYALYHRLRATKHADENYHLNSTTDQLYRGYNYEQRHPNIAVGTQATRGIVATHPSMVNEKNTIGAIVAAYSSCTDGRTRSYVERWGGTPGLFPYLISVPDPDGLCTNQRWLQGLDGNHMVGMSALGALRSVANQNLTYDAVLRYYYTGVSLLRAYQ
ncbi:MAG: hypothetical protein HY567_00725 [Candidatus Kerfeldbacteria bacterium]|nr:hypothetical protein [Candidatus Kerfeldbacteria bacterium]